MHRAVLVAVAVALIGLHGEARLAARQPTQPLNFFKNYFVTGDYVVGGIGLRGGGVGGIATGNIAISGVPAAADVLGAFLYWQTVVSTSNVNAATVGVTFNGQPVGGVEDATGTIATLVNPAGTTPCWSAGGAAGPANGSKTLAVFRADVLRFITDLDPVSGKLAVNRSFQVQVPDGGNGNSLPLSNGAGLVIVYRDPSKPLRAIVLYDGGFSLDHGHDRLDLVLNGFYQSSLTAPAARLSTLVGDGQANFSERVQVNGVDLAGFPLQNGPFRGTQGADWDNPTFDSTHFSMPAGAESISLSVNRDGLSSYDCLSWGTVVFSTAVQDIDLDGLVDRLEDQNPPPSDPNGNPLPNLKAMGAGSDRKDVFFEVGFMATGGYVGGQGTVPAHSHLPSQAVVDMVGNALRDAPVPNPGGPPGIRAHIDVGANYPGDPYVIPAAHARGGEMIAETFCDPSTSTCEFPDYPGTVGWKSGFQFLRDAVVNPADPVEEHRPRFDTNRLHSFRYVLFAHALGLASPDFPDVPTKTSGVADPPGGDLMITLGSWDDFVGSDFMQGATWLHEFGHTGNLRHGGAPLVLPTGQTILEPNCKPNHLSVMSYLFQTRGLICDATSTVPSCAGRTGLPVIDFARQNAPGLNEDGLVESAGLGALPYRTRWYSPTSFLDEALFTTPPTKHCDGSPLESGEVGLFRIEGTSATGGIDWNANGTIAGTQHQDASFSGLPLQVLNPATSDWLALDLRHVASRRNVGGLSIGVTASDLGKGDLGKGDLGDLGKGDLGKGDLGKGDLGKGDLGKGDLGKGDLGVPASEDAPLGDLDLDTARQGNAPNLLAPVVGNKAITLTWTPPHVDETAIDHYLVFRVIGTTVTPANFATRVLVSGTPVLGTSVVDGGVKNNVTYTYFVQAQFTLDGEQVLSGVSNFQSVTK